METNSIVGTVGIICIAFSLIFIFVVGMTTIVKKAKQVYNANTDKLITSAEAKVITDNQTAINNKLNKIKPTKE